MMSRSTVRWAALSAVLAIAAATPSQVATGQSLRTQRDSVYAKIKEFRAKKSESAEKAADYRSDLRRCQARLRQAQDELDAAKKRELDTRNAIVAASRAASEAAAELKRAQARYGERLVAMEKAGPGDYLQVVMGAGDFAELAGQSYLYNAVVEADAELLRAIEQRRTEAERRQVELERQKRRVQEEAARIDAAKKVIAAETARAEELTRKAQAAVDEIERQLDELEAQSQALTYAIKAMTSGGKGYSGKWTGPWARPASGPITSGFGMRMHPIIRSVRMHTGIDISAGYGSAVCAAGSGKVISTGWQGGYGNTIIVDHGGGRTTLYAHLSSIQCAVGQVVSSGQRIGSVGSTGLSTGPHLHWEVRIGGSPVNPLGG